jgi:hypothetical protein
VILTAAIPGDGNLDGTVNFLDYNIVKTNYLHTTGDVGVQAVPEPATLAGRAGGSETAAATVGFISP